MADTSTDPGHRSVPELEREVDEERARLSSTIDALQGKASMGNILDEFLKVARDNGGEMSRNLGRTVRDNPLPALLTGVGLAWLMAGSGEPRSRLRDDHYDDDPDRFNRLGTLPAGDMADWAESGTPSSTYPASPATGYGSDLHSNGGDGGPGLGERASQAAAGARDRASGLADEVGARAAGARDRASGFADEVGARAADARHAAGARMSEAGDALRSAGHSARAGLSGARRRASHAGSDARDLMDDMIEDQPLVLGALALAFGAALGGALPSSRTEDKMFGARSDRAKDALGRVAREEGEKLRATAGAVAEEARHIVDETSGEASERLPDGREAVDAAADRVTEAAGRLRDAGEKEAERQDLGHPKRSV